jgi:uncharacterized protein with ParB-like and HNH nuclease domain
MSNLEPITGVITIKELLEKDLQIPIYQRPYKWDEKNVNQLIDDILFHKDKSAYRLGTLVIYNDKEDKKKKNINEKEEFFIVDGQQRTLTIILIAYALDHCGKYDLKKILSCDKEIINPDLLKIEFLSDISKKNIQNNYKIIERRIKTFEEQDILFFLKKCELVRVTIFELSEAFQFFDSQYARGKDLQPHDLLKAFHLREMNNFSTQAERIETVEKWEAMDKDKLSKLFSLYLYRIRNWSKGLSARSFSKNDVDVFKGINPDNNENYPFSKIFRIVHYYSSVHEKINQNKFDYPFQIDQTIINGRRFFEMIAYYDKMIDDIKNMKDNQIIKTIDNYEGCYRDGDNYVRILFYCGLVYYIDKFGDKELERAVDKIFIWAYSLRLEHIRVQLASIDNHALGNVQLFKIIREAIRPNKILNLQLSKIENIESTKTKDIEDAFRRLEYL